MNLPALFSENIRTFMAELFEGNEQLAVDSQMLPLTDEQLEALVRRCFASNKEVISSLDNLSSTVKSRIRVWRSEYNRGLWGTPKVVSFRYGEEGKPINRHGHVLSEKEVELVLAKEGKRNASLRTESQSTSSPSA